MPTAAPTNMIVLQDVRKAFNAHEVLRGATLEIRTGETMVVIGGSGVGKSVLLKHLIGLLHPDRGRVLVNGQDLATLDEQQLSKVRRQFGMLFQASALFDSLTVWENVGFGLRQHTPLSDEEIRRIAEEKLAIVGLQGVADLMPAELSGGMKKRVGLARAIAMEPRILLYDEPTTGLDPIMADVINELIIELKRTRGETAVAITHDMKSAYKIADRIAMLYDGVILEVGTPDEIRNSQHPVVQQFITGRATGPISTGSICPKCLGSGTVSPGPSIHTICSLCQGSGRAYDRRQRPLEPQPGGRRKVDPPGPGVTPGR